MKVLKMLSVAVLTLWCGLSAAALGVADLRVDKMHCPQGIDSPTPAFSWKLSSSRRGVMQTAYEVTVYSDAERHHAVWSSGRVKSSRSLDVPATGIRLKPSTRYFWRVKVTSDRDGRATSTEQAWFDTGLMGTGWSGARWIKAGQTPYEKACHYTVEADMQPYRAAASLVFAAHDWKTYHVWQFSIGPDSVPLLRRLAYVAGAPSQLGSDGQWSSSAPKRAEVRLEAFTTSELRGGGHPVKIEVTGREIKTFLDGRLVDTFTDNSGILTPGRVGSSVTRGKCHADDFRPFARLRVTEYDTAGNSRTRHVDNFEGGPDTWPEADIMGTDGNRQLIMQSTPGEYMVLEKATEGSVPRLRKEFVAGKKIASAHLHATALGVYDLFVNGRRVGHAAPDATMAFDEMKPGWTDYREKVFYQSFDVTPLVRTGRNAIGAWVSAGWWAGGIAYNKYGTREVALMAKLVIDYADGTTDTIVTDPSWRSSKDGALRFSDIYDGEVYDARRADRWTEADYDDTQWLPVAVSDDFQGRVVAGLDNAPRTPAALRMSPRSVTVYDGATPSDSDFGMIRVVNRGDSLPTVHLKKGQTVLFDFGQNFAGWVDFRVRGGRGTTLNMRFGEMLNDTGALSRGNDGPGGSLYTANLRTALARMGYTLAGDEDGESHRPQMTFFGFRYCEMTADGDIDILKVYGQPLTSVHEETGSLHTNVPVVNQLASNIRWGQLSNMISVPTDCPQRNERLGWAGDTQVFSRAGMYQGNMETFYAKWLGDMRDSQRDDGAYPIVAPLAWVGYGTAAWADAGVIVPWNVYVAYGDTAVIRDNYAAMEHYMDWLGTQHDDNWRYLGPGTGLGDWLSFVPTDDRYISMAYYACDAMLMSRMSRVLSHDAADTYARKAADYLTLYNHIKDEFQQRYFTDSISQRTQTAYLLALKWNLTRDEAQRRAVIDSLSTDIARNGEMLNTGFVGTSTINQTLSDVGLSEHAFNLLEQRRCPSWLYSVDQGATTVWERWNSYTLDKGFGPVSMNSFNHYAYGAVGEWLYRYVAGISPDEEQPGYRHFFIQPVLDTRRHLADGMEPVREVECRYESRYGQIVSSWNMNDDGAVNYHVTVPPNTTATLRLPAASAQSQVTLDGQPLAKVKGVTCNGYADGQLSFTVGSGDYRLVVK